MPILPPASKPNDFVIIEYAPPDPILIFDVIDERDKAVQTVIDLANNIIATAPRNPALPTTQPSRRNIITPSMVRTSGVKTPPNTPNFFILKFLVLPCDLNFCAKPDIPLKILFIQ